MSGSAIRGAVEFYAAGSLLLLLVTGPLIAWLLHRGLEPLRQLAALAAQVSVDAWEFSPPASARTTRELAPLTQAIESVLQRLERSFVQQRTFVSDAAHELKTAVAVAQVVAATAGPAPAHRRRISGRPRSAALPTPTAWKSWWPKCSPWHASKTGRNRNGHSVCTAGQRYRRMRAQDRRPISEP